jgi:hypothetical protein
MEAVKQPTRLVAILAWSYAVVIGGGGLIGALQGEVLTGILFFASALFVFPPLNAALRRVGISPPPKWIKASCAVALFVGAGATIPPDKSSGAQSESVATEQSRPAPVSVTPPQPVSRPQSTKEITRAFTECLVAKAKSNDSYTSLDGGKSAVMLLGDCEDTMNAYVDDCKSAGGTEGDCTVKAGLLSQAGLKLLNR